MYRYPKWLRLAWRGRLRHHPPYRVKMKFVQNGHSKKEKPDPNQLDWRKQKTRDHQRQACRRSAGRYWKAIAARRHRRWFNQELHRRGPDNLREYDKRKKFYDPRQWG